MRFFYLFMVLPILSAQAAPNCARLKVITEEIENKVQKNLLEKCDEIKPADLGLPDNTPGFDGGPDDYRCKDFSIIDAQLKSIENEIAMIKGIMKLKEEIKNGIQTLGSIKDPNLAVAASQSFMQNLRVAANMEVLLLTNNDKKENILSHVVNDPNGWVRDDKTSLAALITKICKDFKSSNPVNVCTSEFVMDEATFKEIQSFLIMGKNSKKFDKKHVQDLRDALSIKKGNEDYSYNQLLQEIKNPGEGSLSVEDIAKLKSFPALEKGSNKYSFLRELRQSVTNLKSAEGIIQAQDIPNRFQSLVSDLKNREEWELKSKLSLILHQMKDKIPASLKDKCDSVRELGGDIAETCLKPLMKDMEGSDKALLDHYSYVFKYGQNHLDKLNNILKTCIPKPDLSYDAGCDKIFDEFNTKLENLAKRSQVLQALKTKHLQSKPELITMRNFAVSKLLAGKCTSQGDASINCDIDLGSISKEAVALGATTGEIIHILENPSEDVDVENICSQGKETISFKEELCELMEEDPEKKRTSQLEKDSFMAPVDAPTMNRNGEAFLQAGQTLMSALADFFAPKQPMINPYASNINPYPMMASPQDISQKIMTPYIATGYGSYFPTPGLRPYSSIGSNVGTFSAYDMGSGKLFNSPVGW